MWIAKFPSWNLPLDRSEDAYAHRDHLCTDINISNDRIRPTIRWPYQDLYIMHNIIIWKTYTHFIVGKCFFPVPIDMFAILLFSTLQAAYRVCLGKIFAEILARGTSALPCASCRSMDNSTSQTMGSSSWPSMVWPLYISAANDSVHAKHQLYFLSPNCSKLPENFLLSKWIKMATSVSLSTCLVSTKQLNQYNL